MVNKPIVVTLDRDAFSSTVNRASIVINNNNLIQAYRFVHCHANAETDEITIQANNGELSCVIETGGVSCIEGTDQVSWLMDQRAVKVLNTIKEVDNIKVLVTENGFVLNDGKSTYPFETMDVEDWPVFVAEEPNFSIDIPLERVIKDLYKCTSYTDSDSSRFALGGVRVGLSDDGVELVATDNRRLVWMPTGTKEFEHYTTIPKDSIRLINSITKPYLDFADVDETIATFSLGNTLTINTPGLTIQTRCIEGRFPDYKQIVPDKNEMPHVFEFDTEQLKGHLNALKIYAPKEARGIDLGSGNGRMTFVSGRSLIETEVIVPEFETMSVDVDRFSQALIFGDTVTMGMTDADSAIRFDFDDSGTVVVLMPLARD